MKMSSRIFLLFTLPLFFYTAVHCKSINPLVINDFNRFEENGKVGLKNQKGEILIPAQFDALGWSNGEFSIVENAIGYRINGQWGLISTTNHKITKNEFIDLSPGPEQVLIARKKIANSVKVKTGCITTAGKTLVPFLYDGLSISSLRAIVYEKTGTQFKHGLIDLNNKILVPLKYQAIYPLGSLRYAVVSFDNKTAIFTDDGKQLTNFLIDSISSFKKSYAIIYQNQRQGLINREGQIKIEPTLREIKIEDDGAIKIRHTDAWIFLNGENKLIRQFNADSIQPAQRDIYKIKSADRIELANAEFKPLTKVVISSIGNFYKGKALFESRGRTGLLGSDGSVLIEAKYLNLIIESDRIRASSPHQGMKQWVLMDTVGNVVSEKRYDFIAPYNGVFYPAKRKNFWGALNKDGKEVISCVHDSLVQYHNDHIVVKFKDQYGIINVKENWIIPPQNDPLQLINSDRYLQVSQPNTFLKSLKGEIIYFTENRIDIKPDYLLEYVSTGAIWKIDMNGLIADRYVQQEGIEKIFMESEGYRAIKKDGKYGFVDDRARLRIANRYEDVKPFNEGMAGAKILGRWGYINKDDRIAIQPVYDDVFQFHHGYAVVKQKGLFGLIDKNGKLILPVRYDAIEMLPTNRFLIKQNGLYGAADSNGRIILNIRYHSIQDVNNNYLIVGLDNKWGVITTQGLSTIPLIYDGIIYDQFHKQFLALRKAAWEVAQIQ
jgi:hypothetical protein